MRGRATTLAPRPRDLLRGPCTACGPFVVRGDSAPPLASIGKGENLRQGERKGETSVALCAVFSPGGQRPGESWGGRRVSSRRLAARASAPSLVEATVARASPAALLACARRCGLLSSSMLNYWWYLQFNTRLKCYAPNQAPKLLALNFSFTSVGHRFRSGSLYKSTAYVAQRSC